MLNLSLRNYNKVSFIPSESIDLIYLDPPFNSKADYNILFKEKTGARSTAQIQASLTFGNGIAKLDVLMNI